jgi:hypothetical protein
VALTAFAILPNNLYYYLNDISMKILYDDSPSREICLHCSRWMQGRSREENIPIASLGVSQGSPAHGGP